jgi:creatinine amidohydrolase
MLALRPDLVEMDKAEDFVSAQTALDKNSEKLGYHGAPANLSWLAQDLNRKGAVGDASAAKAEAGHQDIRAVAEGFCALIADLQRLPAQEAPE